MDTTKSQGLPTAARILIASVTVTGLTLLLWTLPPGSWEWSHMLGLGLVLSADLFRVDMQQYKATHKISITLDIVASFFILQLLGLPWAMLSLLISTLFFGLTRRMATYKIAYNVGTLIISIWAANLLIQHAPISHLLAVFLAAILYFLINTTSIAAIIAIVSVRPLLSVWRENYTWMALQHIALAIAGHVLGDLVIHEGWSVLLVALPMPMLHYTYTLYTKSNSRHTQELGDLSNELITTLGAVVDARDAYTFGHSTHVARYSVGIAQQLGYNQEALTRLYRSALLHDIGKVGIPERILFKPARLTADEYESMKRHTLIGYEIIKQIRALKQAATVALCHHERWDGKGYPGGLSGTQIDLDSRIVAVADTLETLLSDRPYRQGSSLEESLHEISRCAGTQFDPAVVRALQALVEEKGNDFFVNSARLVEAENSPFIHWHPVEPVAVAAGEVSIVAPGITPFIKGGK